MAFFAMPAVADDFALVPEMERPPGIVAAAPAARKAFGDDAEAVRGLERLRGLVRELWPSIREVDVLALSRYQRQATEGFRLPASPGALAGQAIGRDDDQAGGAWYLELRGPRLPARYDIVYRYLYVYARWDPATETFSRLTVTIRGWVEE